MFANRGADDLHSRWAKVAKRLFRREQKMHLRVGMSDERQNDRAVFTKKKPSDKVGLQLFHFNAGTHA